MSGRPTPAGRRLLEKRYSRRNTEQREPEKGGQECHGGGGRKNGSPRPAAEARAQARSRASADDLPVSEKPRLISCAARRPASTTIAKSSAVLEVPPPASTSVIHACGT